MKTIEVDRVGQRGCWVVKEGGCVIATCHRREDARRLKRAMEFRAELIPSRSGAYCVGPYQAETIDEALDLSRAVFLWLIRATDEELVQARDSQSPLSEQAREELNERWGQRSEEEAEPFQPTNRLMPSQN